MRHKLSILLTIASSKWGGREQHVLDLAKGMKQQGHTVCVITEKPLVARFAEYVEAVDLPMKIPLFDIYSIVRLVKEILYKKIDIVHVHGGREKWLALIAIKLAGRGKLFVSRHTVQTAKTDRVHLWLHNQITKTICVSKCVKDEYIGKSMTGRFLDKVTVVYNGIDEKRFQNDVTDKGNFKNQRRKLIIGFAGRVSAEKGVEYLIDAAGILKRRGYEFSLLIAGEGPVEYRAKLDENVKMNELSENVKFLGFIKDVEEFMNQIDIFVLPCVWQEAFGLVLCEAMICRKPVVTTARGAQKEIVVDGESGLLVETGSFEALAGALEKLMQDEELREKIGIAGEQVVRSRFLLEHMVKNMEQCYCEGIEN